MHKSIVCKLQSVPVVPQSRSGACWRELCGTGTSMNGLAACPAINKSMHFLVKFPLTIHISPLSAQDLTCHLGILPTASTLSPMARILSVADSYYMWLILLLSSPWQRPSKIDEKRLQELVPQIKWADILRFQLATLPNSETRYSQRWRCSVAFETYIEMTPGKCAAEVSCFRS